MVVVMVELVVEMLVVYVTLVMTTSWVIGSNMLFLLRFLWGRVATSVSAWAASRLDNTARYNSSGISGGTVKHNTTAEH